MKITLQSPNSMHRRYCQISLIIQLSLACFALSPQARAVCQEGCFTNVNSVLGEDALLDNVTSSQNVAIGFRALSRNVGGSNNTVNGAVALFSNMDGSANTATGHSALSQNTVGNDNTAIGANTLVNNNGSGNIALGAGSGDNLRTGSNNIYIGNAGADESKTIRIGTTGGQGKTFIAGISGVTVPDGVGVIVGSNGRLGTATSSARFKEEIKPMDKVSETILALQPVTFRYNKKLDPAGVPQFGLVAEDVEKVNADLIARDEHGRAYTVRYEAVNAMLLNEFLKEHRTVEELKKEIAALTAMVKDQASRMEKLSAHFEANQLRLQRVVSNEE